MRSSAGTSLKPKDVSMGKEYTIDKSSYPLQLKFHAIIELVVKLIAVKHRVGGLQGFQQPF